MTAGTLGRRPDRGRARFWAGLLLGALGATVATLAVMKAPRGAGTAGSRGAGATPGGEAAPAPSEVQEMAAQLDCACGTCHLRLDQCTCSMPAGAVEVKQFIRERVEEGKYSAEEILSLARTFSPQHRPLAPGSTKPGG